MVKNLPPHSRARRVSPDHEQPYSSESADGITSFSLSDGHPTVPSACLRAVGGVFSSKKLSRGTLRPARRFFSLPNRQNQQGPHRWLVAAAASTVEVDSRDSGGGGIATQLLDSDSNIVRTNRRDGQYIDADSLSSSGSFLAATNRSEGSGGDGGGSKDNISGAGNLNNCHGVPRVEGAEQATSQCPTSNSHTRRRDDTTRRFKRQGVASHHIRVAAAHVGDLHHDGRREVDGVDEVGMASGERRL